MQVKKFPVFPCTELLSSLHFIERNKQQHGKVTVTPNADLKIQNLITLM